MSTITKDLGAVSAYAYAVEQGYTGTEAEFAELMASYATVAQQASQSAQTATEKAQQASASATSAQASATTATAKASEAQQSATTATTKAQEASQSASTASQKAQEASQSASDAQTAKTASETAQGLAESARDSAVSAKSDAESARDDAETARDEAQQAVASISGALADKAPVITDTASGSIASFSDGADNLPLKSLIVDINPIQDLSHGDPSPENICPISGRTRVGVEQRGKNLFPFGADVTAVGNISYLQDVPIFRKGQTVTLSADVEWGGGYTSSTVFSLGKNRRGTTNIYFDATRRGGTRTATEDVYGFNFYATSSGTTNPGVTTIYRNVQLELGSTATPYEPYTGRSITIDLGQTVYGAKLYPLEGKAVITHGYLQKNTADMNNSEDYPGWKVSDIRGLIGGGINGRVYGAFTNISPASAYDRCGGVGANTNGETDNTLMLFREYFSKSQTEWQALALDVQFVIPLATPIEIQLSANQINSLYGVNNIWADTGDTEVEYRANTTLYINKKIAEAVSALS